MTPPRSPDTGPVGGVAREGEYDEIVAELAEVSGVINVAEARRVALTARALEIGVSGGTHLTPEKWLEWQTGVTPGRAGDVVKLASRASELPHTVAALEAGELSVDQAAAIARYVPARYDRSAALVAPFCTVRQLREVLRWYRDKPPANPGARDDRRSVSTGVDEQGWWIRGRLPEAEGAIVDQALKAMGDDLRRRAAADAPDGTEPVRVSAADALIALAETALKAGEAARPGTDRYLVHVHLEAGPNGTLELMTHLGIPLPEGQRRHILCDTRLRALVHDGITPLGTGRVTRTINRRLRRAVEHRDGGCAVPGCGATHRLEIHHIWHWEDGGPTNTSNLVALCAHHHTLHHQGLLGIEGNADRPRHTQPGIVFTDRWGRPLNPTGTPTRPTPPTPGQAPTAHLTAAASAIGITAKPYDGPTGERLDRWAFHLNPDPPDPDDLASTANHDTTNEPPPHSTGQRPRTPGIDQAAPGAHVTIDPTRAGPARL